MRRSLLALALVVTAGTFVTAATATATATHAVRPGPPWISIEYPGNPLDRENPNTYLYVHTFHHGDATDAAPRGRAEGIVGTERRSLPLSFQRTSRAGRFALRQQWPREGTWMLVISTGPANGSATALVDIGAAGDVSAVRVPSARRDGWMVPSAVGAGEVDATLRARATGLARAGSR